VVAHGLHVLSDKVVLLVDLKKPLVLALHRGGLMQRIPKAQR
jgi:hypothetical protein